MIELFDRLGYDEAWVGEHHSAGWETIGHPEMFLAAAAQRTHRIMLGTGVVSLPYHHPYNVASRITHLDHLSRGRAILGTGPGALPSDARTFGVDPALIRDRQDESLAVILRLLRSDEPFSASSDWFDMHEGLLQVKPVQEDLEVVCAVSISPSGMRLAGKHGIGAISLASYSEEGLNALPTQWGWAQTYAEEHGTTVDRSRWRVVVPWHLAKTKEQALDEVAEGVAHWHNEYNVGILGRPGAKPTSNPRKFAERMSDSGGGLFGTPDDVVEGIAKLQALAGGFGTLVGFVHDWADHEATLRSYDLFARYVIPEVNGMLAPVRRSADEFRANKDALMGASSEAIRGAIREHNRTHPRPEPTN